MNKIQIQAASPKDCDKVALLLKTSGLPISDINSCLDGFVVARNNGTIVGTGGLEFFGDIALLRSVAVDASLRGQKIGEKINEQLFEIAQKHGVKNLYLLTTDAHDYFKRFGFKPISRDGAPEAIQSHAQFTQLCPSSAIIMKKTI